jgi:hypothetical protein
MTVSPGRVGAETVLHGLPVSCDLYRYADLTGGVSGVQWWQPIHRHAQRSSVLYEKEGGTSRD